MCIGCDDNRGQCTYAVLRKICKQQKWETEKSDWHKRENKTSSGTQAANECKKAIIEKEQEKKKYNRKKRGSEQSSTRGSGYGKYLWRAVATRALSTVVKQS